MSIKVTPKVFHFHSAVRWKAGKLGETEAESRPALLISSPPEFRGEPGRWTPEEMLVAAVNSCLMLTFLAYAERERLEITGYESRASGTLEWSEGALRFTSFRVEPVIGFSGASAAQVEEVLAKAERNCPVGNSLRAAVEVVPSLTAAAA